MSLKIKVYGAMLLGLSMWVSSGLHAEDKCEEKKKPTIVEIASSNENFSTLVTTIKAAGLAETLSSEGEFTVFAPTNAAFEGLPEGALEALLEDTDALKNVLLYHVVGAIVPAKVAVTLKSAKMLNGEEITLNVINKRLFLNDNVEVVVTDIMASNGIIHVIDAVLIPSVSE